MKSPELSLLSDISDIISRSHDLYQTLDHIVELVRSRMYVDCCSLYLLDRLRRYLILRATEGLSSDSIGRVKMRPKEGLVGLVFEQKKLLCVKNAFEHPRFKYFPLTKEERFHSFLGVPLIARRISIGVLVVQTKKEREFSDDETQMFVTLASQISSVVVSAELVDLLFEKYRDGASKNELQALSEPVPANSHKSKLARKNFVLKGLPASQGIGFGKAVVIRQSSFEYLSSMLDNKHNLTKEKSRFKRAVSETFKEVSYIQKTVADTLSEKEAELFHAPLLLLEDEYFSSAVEKYIDKGLFVPQALEAVLNDYKGIFGRIDDAYLKDRFIDLQDVARRVAENYAKKKRKRKVHPRERIVLCSDPLSLISLGDFENGAIAGIVSESGGINSHAVILAKSFEIPSVIAIDGLLESVKDNDELIIDGLRGVVIINPDESIKREFEQSRKRYIRNQKSLIQSAESQATTIDGIVIPVLANVGIPHDVELAIKFGADGIGLYRTELSFMDSHKFPTEEEQFAIYKLIAQKMIYAPLVIRTLDIGGDKLMPFFGIQKEENPFLGWRAIRISLAMPNFFKVQLKAILRAGVFGDVLILLPMISSVEEVVRTKEFIEEVKVELTKEGKQFADSQPVGIMVEIPAAVEIIEDLLNHVDFVSIGTNDLIQYFLAVDRNNERVSAQFEPYHPAVLKAISRVVKACKKAGKYVSVCGEMAADPLASQILVGMGISALSVAPQFVPKIKVSIRQVCYKDLEQFASSLLEARSTREVKLCIEDKFTKFRIIPKE